MNKKNIAILVIAIIIIAGLITAGVLKKKGVFDKGTANQASADVATKGSADTAKKDPTPTPNTDYADNWTYKIVLDGFYNASATWSEDGKLVSGPSYEVGSQVYYSDCDEYYNNFVNYNNVFNEATMFIDDIYAHSSDNSEKITNRLQWTKGFSGFRMALNANNALDFAQLNGKTITFGMFVYYTDEFGLGVPEEMTFAYWSNLNPSVDSVNEVKSTDENALAEEQLANEQGFYKIMTFTVPANTWTYVEVTTPVNTTAESPSLYFATLGESYNSTVACYNPFYIDDLHMEIVE